ncbi:hypothetical protein ABTM49_19710, partial [Acinetobacter baumannii]
MGEPLLTVIASVGEAMQNVWRCNGFRSCHCAAHSKTRVLEVERGAIISPQSLVFPAGLLR